MPTMCERFSSAVQGGHIRIQDNLVFFSGAQLANLGNWVKIGDVFSRNFHDTIGLSPSSRFFQTYVDKVVCPSAFLSFKVVLCLGHLFLKFLASPT